ncbi:DUF4333 domain-containing protein [Mycolicibacterium sp.]|uniref:DUF4333 domain-containing protein n=1 Tax=Mycolicibacterium sp. TaxID=2320850 RepID=UPI00355E5199
MSGPYGERPRPQQPRRPRPGPDDPTVAFRRPPPPPPEEPWWRTVNQRPAPVPPPQPRPAPPAPPPVVKRAPAKSSRWWIVAGAAVVLLGGVALGVGLSTLNPVRDNVLEVSQVEDDVTAVLLDPVDGYGVTGLTKIRCNDGDDPVVAAGAEFRCEVVVDDKPQSVLAVFQDDAGTYAVDRPR